MAQATFESPIVTGLYNPAGFTNESYTDDGINQLKIFYKALEGIIGSIGVVGNAIVLFVFFRDKSLRSLINSFIINQSMIDFTTSLVFMLISFLPPKPLSPSNRGHVFLCQFWLSEFVLWALFISSSVNLVCLTFDRYYAIVYPMRYRASSAKIQRRIKLIAVVTWCSGFVLDSYWPAIHIVTPSGFCFPNWSRKTMQGVTGVFIFIVTYAGPLSVMIFCYTRIIYRLLEQTRRTSIQAQQQLSPSTQNLDAVHKIKTPAPTKTSDRSAKATRNVIKTLLMVSLTYAICWAPIAFNYLVYNLGGPLDFSGAWYAFTKIFVDLNMCANPFIYTMQYEQFQKGFERAFRVKIFKGLSTESKELSTSGGGVQRAVPSSGGTNRVDLSV